MIDKTSKDVIQAVATELERARNKHLPMQSAHEGYAVILEELDELWEEVKRQNLNWAALEKEAIQVAAMAVRFVEDICRNRAVPFGGEG